MCSFNRRLRVSSLLTGIVATLISVNAGGTADQDLLQHDWPVDEYCAGETFRPRCAGGKTDVIVVLSARYGRMSFGRCLKKQAGLALVMNDPKFLGCSADVKDIIDHHCSGRSECDVRINDQNFEAVKPCYEDLKMHLEASYTCVRVVAESRHCTVTLTAEPQHIVVGSRTQLVQSDNVGCGTESQPWSIEGLAGQRVAVSMIHFSPDHNNSSNPLSCHPSHGYILDRNTRQNVSICGDGSHDERQRVQRTPLTRIYVSSSNRLQIVARLDVQNNFLIRVEAVGCSDLAPPSNDAWLKRVDNQVTIGCYMSRQSWQLNCVNGEWIGTVGVCTNPDSNNHLERDIDQSSLTPTATSFNYGKSNEVAALVAVASTGVALCSIVICVGVFCLNRQRKPDNKKASTTYFGNDGETANEINKLNTGSHC